MAKGRQGKRTDPDVRDYIVDRALEGWNAAQILRALEQDKRLANRAPGIRTVQTIVRETTTRDMSAQWAALAEDSQAALVLPVLGDVIAARGSVSITNEHARLIAWLRTVAPRRPEIPLEDVYELARRLAVMSPDEQNERIVPYLALTPWRDRGKRYMDAYGRHGFRRLMVGDWVVDFAASQEITYDIIDSEEEPER